MATELTFTRRADIQGLRAVAVLLVIASHLPSWGKFAGGFIGVDIFFVISGYVITRLLLIKHQNREAKFSREYFKFMWARVQRLVPALFVMIATVTLLAFLLGPPLEFRSTSRAALWSELFLSNFYFLRSFDSYWNPEILRNPFLHTWSLGVEFQIYLVLPFALFALITFGLKKQGTLTRAIFWMGLISIGSLILFAVLVSFELSLRGISAQGAAFYLPFTRFWEFGAGAIAVLIGIKKTIGLAILRPLTYIGWVLIVIGGFGSHIIANVSLFLVPVVLGTALVLMSGEGGSPSLTSQTLGSAPLVWLGDRSYSLYLWHWPLLIFAMWLLPNSPIGALTALALALLCADLSYRFLERRKRPQLNGQTGHSSPLRNNFPRLLVSSALVLLLTFGLSQAGQMTWYLRANVPEYTLREASVSSAEVLSAMEGCEVLEQQIHCDYFGEDTPRVVIIGDSLGYRAFPAVAFAARELGFNASELWQGGCSVEVNSCPDFIYEYLAENDVAALLVTTNFDRESSLVNAAEKAGGEAPECLAAPTSACELHVSRVAEFERRAVAGLQQLQTFTPNVLVASTFPQQSPESWTGLYPPLIQRVGPPPEGRGTTSLAWQRERQGLYPDAIARAVAENPGVQLWQPYDFLCDSNSCPGVIDAGEQIMDDPIHWSWPASRFLYQPIRDFLVIRLGE